jgi:citrate lyase subunit beta/citryl-CoA lyase
MSTSTNRSVLYVPGSNEKALAKARSLECDAIIFDWEDSVSETMKDAARDATLGCLADGGFDGKTLVIRANGMDTDFWTDDIAAVSQAPVQAVLVPKVSSSDDIYRVHGALAGANDALKVWAMIETCLGMLNLPHIAACAANGRLQCLVLGLNDLAKETGAIVSNDRSPFFQVMTSAVIAARANGLDVVDAVYNFLEDASGFSAECRQAVSFGFSGKTLIHPNQIATCNAAFSPSVDEINWAREVVAAFDFPENRDKGALRIHNQLVERLHLAKAHRILAIARQ